MPYEIGTGIDPGADLNKSFHLASLRMLADLGLSGAHQSQALEVIRQFQLARDKEETNYRATYDDRVKDSILKLQNRAAGKDDDHKPRWGTADRFNPNALRLQAEREVRFAHQTTLSLLDTQETRELEEIAKQADRDVPNQEMSPRSSERRSQSHMRSRPRPRD